MFMKQRIQFGLINILYIKKKAYISLVFLNLERKFKVELKKKSVLRFFSLRSFIGIKQNVHIRFIIPSLSVKLLLLTDKSS